MKKSKKEKKPAEVLVVGTADKVCGAYLEVGGVLVLVRFEVVT